MFTWYKIRILNFNRSNTKRNISNSVESHFNSFMLDT